MVTNVPVERAMLLYRQGRYAEAERELRQSLAADPDHPLSHALLAYVLVHQNKFADAEEEARRAVGVAPDEPMGHAALGSVLRARRRYAEAAEAISQAVRLDPSAADYWSLLAQVRVDQRAWPEALAAADRGLANDPEDAACKNLRAIALVHLGRKSDAAREIDGALADDPQNALTHANQGWTHLHNNNPTAALENFREALRLDPTSEWARAGIVEAMKARNVVYRVLMMFFLGMSRLSGRAQGAIIVGGWVGNSLLRSAARQNPDLAPYVLPISVTYVLFVWLTWLADPLFNAVLRTDRYGRHALSRDQVVTSNWILALLGLAATCFAGWLASGGEDGPGHALNVAAIVCLLLTIPVSTIWRCDRGWPRVANVLIVAALGSLGIAVVALDATGASDRVAKPLFSLFLLGTFASSFAVQFLARVTPTR